MLKYGIIDLPKIAIIGKEGLCTKEKNTVQDLWHQANSNFSDIADLGMKNADGSFVGFWGVMSDETMSFLPWADGFSRGLYLAGVEVYEDTPVPDGWVKWVMPARKYLVTKVTPESYGETFESVINCLIPELGMKLAGAVCDFYRAGNRAEQIVFSGGVRNSTKSQQGFSCLYRRGRNCCERLSYSALYGIILS